MNKRSIKFRVWDETDKQMVEWLEARDTELLNDAFDEKNAMAMQFTGLLDVLGNEIYEGDIVKNIDENPMFSNGIYRCFWNDLKYCFEWSSCYKTTKPLWQINPEIIGNILEKPELMKETNG